MEEFTREMAINIIYIEVKKEASQVQLIWTLLLTLIALVNNPLLPHLTCIELF